MEFLTRNGYPLYSYEDYKHWKDRWEFIDGIAYAMAPTNEYYLTKAPEIVFEVLSKSTAKKDLSIKYELYEKEGVKYYFIINPDDSVAKVYRLKDGRYIKVGDFSDEVFEFSIDKCDKKLKFDFSRIWE